MLRCTGLADKCPGQLARRQRSFWLGTSSNGLPPGLGESKRLGAGRYVTVRTPS
jgi:hypothetical protein